MRIQSLTLPLLASVSLGACSSAFKPPEIKYDDTPRQAVLQPDPPKPVQIVELPKPLPLPGQLKPIPGAKTAPADPANPYARVEEANARPGAAVALPACSTSRPCQAPWPRTKVVMVVLPLPAEGS
jgi:hypothetical protein